MWCLHKTMMLGREANCLGSLGMNPKPSRPSSSDGRWLGKANFQTPSVNGTKTNLKMVGEESLINLKCTREKKQDIVADTFAFGKALKDRRIFSQNFTIRSYDMGPNHTATIETVMNLLQETVLNHLRSIGLLRDGLGSTPEMSGRNLIWVLSKIHVEVDHYPSWNDDVQVDNWFTSYEKYGHGTDWIISNCSTGKTLIRATSVFLMMNKETRKISKTPEEVIREIEPHYIKFPSVVNENSSTLPKLDYRNMEFVRTGLTPRWNDLDANQHVNNVKYIGLMIESVPISFLENHELFGVNLEYRRECSMVDVLQSLTSVCHETIDHGSIGSDEERFHLLRLESGAVVARGRTRWRTKNSKEPVYKS